MSAGSTDFVKSRRGIKRLFRRRPVYGPPLPDIECGEPYLTADEAYELVHLLGDAITRAKRIEHEYRGGSDPVTEG